MIIYLEGVDGSGKTTLKDALATRLTQLKGIKNIEVVADGESLIPTRPTNPKRLNALELLTKLHDMANDLNVVYICDRGPISDLIYRTFDHYSPVINLEVFWTFWMANQHFIVTVFCDTDSAFSRMKSRGDENQYAVENHRSIRYLYQQFMPMFGPVKYDLTVEGKDMLKTTNQILARLWAGKEAYMTMQPKTLLKPKGD